MNIPKPEKSLYSTGYLCQKFQESMGTIQRGLDLLNIAPALALNDIAYYLIDDERDELLRAYFHDRRENTKRNAGAKFTSEPITKL
jgi:hypothetical protein